VPVPITFCRCVLNIVTVPGLKSSRVFKLKLHDVTQNQLAYWFGYLFNQAVQNMKRWTYTIVHILEQTPGKKQIFSQINFATTKYRCHSFQISSPESIGSADYFDVSKPQIQYMLLRQWTHFCILCLVLTNTLLDINFIVRRLRVSSVQLTFES